MAKETDVSRKEGNFLFNDALNTFYFTVIWRRTYGKADVSRFLLN